MYAEQRSPQSIDASFEKNLTSFEKFLLGTVPLVEDLVLAARNKRGRLFTFEGD